MPTRQRYEKARLMLEKEVNDGVRAFTCIIMRGVATYAMAGTATLAARVDADAVCKRTV